MREAWKKLERIKRRETWIARGRKIATVLPAVIAGDSYGRWNVKENKRIEIGVNV